MKKIAYALRLDQHLHSTFEVTTNMAYIASILLNWVIRGNGIFRKVAFEESRRTVFDNIILQA